MSANYVIGSIACLSRLSACDWADAVWLCAGCQAGPDRRCTHYLFVERPHGGGIWNGQLCLNCVAALPDPLPPLLAIEPMVACLHLNHALRLAACVPQHGTLNLLRPSQTRWRWSDGSCGVITIFPGGGPNLRL